MNILAVDDDPLVLDLLPVIFQQAKFPNISVADSGAAALEKLNDPEAHYDCLLLDIEMPNMNGIALCQLIRELPRYANTPILMLTSVTDHDRIERAFSAGASDYITKPFDVKDIATRVRIAERMSENLAVPGHFDAQDLPANTPVGKHPFDIFDPLCLARIPQLILPFSLGNYLSQLSRVRIDTCEVFAVRLDEVSDLYMRSNTREFVTALSEAAEAIVKVVNLPNMLMAYEGNGNFLCITQGSQAPEWPGVEADIQDVLSQSTATYDDGTPMKLSVTVGNPITPFASRTQRVKKTFERAAERAAMREKSKRAQARKGADTLQGAT